MDLYTQLALDNGLLSKGLGRREKSRICQTRQDPIKHFVLLHRQLPKIMEKDDPSIMRLVLKLLSISDGERPAADVWFFFLPLCSTTLSASPSK